MSSYSAAVVRLDCRSSPSKTKRQPRVRKTAAGALQGSQRQFQLCNCKVHRYFQLFMLYECTVQCKSVGTEIKNRKLSKICFTLIFKCSKKTVFQQ